MEVFLKMRDLGLVKKPVPWSDFEITGQNNESLMLHNADDYVDMSDVWQVRLYLEKRQCRSKRGREEKEWYKKIMKVYNY